MNIQKKLALFGALALPFAGLATFGGVQAASAASPVLTCQAVAPASGSNGGESFTLNSNGSDPGPLVSTSTPAPPAPWGCPQDQASPKGPPACP